MSDNEWLEQVVALRQQIAREAMEARDGALREQTAAVILAALVARHESGIGGSERALSETAVRLVDALRLELGRAKP